MQVASTLWRDRKSLKILERRFRLKWIKFSPRTKPNPAKTSHATSFGQEEAQTSPTPAVGGGWHPGWVGPTALSLQRGSSALVLNVGSAR